MTKRLSFKELPLFPDDTELGLAIFGDVEKWLAAIPELEREGFPKIDPLTKGRYVPAIRAFFDQKYAITKRPASSEAMLQRHDGLVYVIGFAAYVKIGFTTNLKSRLASLQTGMPEKLIVYGTIQPVEQPEENRLHERFAVYRMEGEWFRKEGELAAWIDAGCKL